MIRLVIYLVIVGLLAAGIGWLADRPGTIVMDWQGLEYKIEVLPAALLLIAAFFFIWLVWTFIRILIKSPDILSNIFLNRREEKARNALAKGMIAVGTGNADAAKRYAHQAEKTLGNEPLVLLLKAQTAQLKGDTAAAKNAFEDMLDETETQGLGLRGLYIEAQRNDDARGARTYLDAALHTDRGSPWALQALFKAQCAEGNWDGALATLSDNVRAGHIDRELSRRLKAVLLTGKAQEIEETEPERALKLSLEAHDLAKDLAPSAVIAGRLLGAKGNMRKASKIIEKTWVEMPHPELAAVYANLRPGDSNQDKIKRAKALMQKAPDSIEGAIAVAEIAIDGRDWSEARAVLINRLEDQATQRVCTLMAEIEEHENGDKGKVRQWLAKAVRAPRDAVWIADGVVKAEWAPTSPVTGELDAFEWRVPDDANLLGPSLDEALYADSLDDIAQIPMTADPIMSDSVAEVGADVVEPIEDAEVVDIEPSAAGADKTDKPEENNPNIDAKMSENASVAVSTTEKLSDISDTDNQQKPEAGSSESDSTSASEGQNNPSESKPDTSVASTSSSDKPEPTDQTSSKPNGLAEKDADISGESSKPNVKNAIPTAPDDPGPAGLGIDDEDAKYRKTT